MGTDLEQVKKIAKILCDSVKIEPLDIVPILCNHPFTDTTIYMCNNDVNNCLNLTDTNVYNQWRKEIFKNIDNSTDIWSILYKIRANYRLVFLKYAKYYIDNATFSQLFAFTWITAENPNDDCNCNLKLLVKWFRESNKTKLMCREDYKVYDELPETFIVYRGVSVGRNPDGLSWTRNLDVARWFAGRFEQDTCKGYVLQALVEKKDVLAYFNTRDEDEIVVDTFALKNIQKLKISSLKYRK